MAAETKMVKARCKKTGNYYGLEVKKVGAEWRVVNMITLSEAEGKMFASEVKQDSFETNTNLIACPKCQSRKVGGCSCAVRFLSCFPGMKYKFDCVYCKNLEIDYSMPVGVDPSKLKGSTVTLAQGKEVKVITFSNVKWKTFDNIAYHPSGAVYHEPVKHVIAKKENIEFHGYNISQMDEGVYYEIGRQDDFEIECDVDTSTINPHPGGYFYVSFGEISARILLSGGEFYLDGKRVARVGSTFRMKLSLTEGGKYEIFIDGQKKGSVFKASEDKVRIVFGFAHDSHHCEKLSHAFLRGIKMRQGVSQQQ